MRRALPPGLGVEHAAFTQQTAAIVGEEVLDGRRSGLRLPDVQDQSLAHAPLAATGDRPLGPATPLADRTNA